MRWRSPGAPARRSASAILQNYEMKVDGQRRAADLRHQPAWRDVAHPLRGRRGEHRVLRREAGAGRGDSPPSGHQRGADAPLLRRVLPLSGVTGSRADVVRRVATRGDRARAPHRGGRLRSRQHALRRGPVLRSGLPHDRARARSGGRGRRVARARPPRGHTRHEGPALPPPLRRRARRARVST